MFCTLLALGNGPFTRRLAFLDLSFQLDLFGIDAVQGFKVSLGHAR